MGIRPWHELMLAVLSGWGSLPGEALGVASFKEPASPWTRWRMAAVSPPILPILSILALWIIGQKWFVEGIAMTGLRGSDRAGRRPFGADDPPIASASQPRH